jgi:DNA primase
MIGDLKMHDINILNTNFDTENWLKENYGCEFIQNNNGWLTATCPFDDHDDMSPSFGIHKEKGIFNCFGCGRNGAFVNLVQQLTNMSFYQTLKFMSENCGLNLKEFNSQDFIYEKFKKALEETNDEFYSNKRIVSKVTMKIKKHLKINFEEADNMYKELDLLLNEKNYQGIAKRFL